MIEKNKVIQSEAIALMGQMEKDSVELQEEYIESFPEDFKTDEDIQNIEKNGSFQSFCEGEYDKYTERF